MTGTREYILFTRGPPVNDLFPGDPQSSYGDPRVPPDPHRMCGRSCDLQSPEVQAVLWVLSI